MAILGILVVLSVSNFTSARLKARDAKRKSDLSTISKALEAYANDHAGYPASDSGDIACTSPATCAWGDPFQDENLTLYAATLPEDSSLNRGYYYVSDTTSYTLYAALENENDPAVQTFTTPPLCGTVDCNYKITSTNIN